jgi:putative transposase
MTRPRPIIRNRCWALARRCTQRQYLMRRDPHVEQVYLYCLGDAVARFEISLHGYVAMSNHHHLIVRDNLGNLPQFHAHLHKMIAKAMNRYLARAENFWALGKMNAVHLVEPQDAFDKLVYLLANPVAAQLVARVADWPGACSLAQSLTGEPRRIRRPKGYFRSDGPTPPEVTLSIERIAGFEHLTDAQWSERIRAAVHMAEVRAADERGAKNMAVLGRDAVLRMPRTDHPTTVEPRCYVRPEVACRNDDQRIAALAAARGFRIAHGNAWSRLRAGERDVVFPEGAYQIRTLGVAPTAADEAAKNEPGSGSRKRTRVGG